MMYILPWFFKYLKFLNINKKNVLNELSLYIDNLQKYKQALENEDQAYLIRLLDEGRKRKEEVDGWKPFTYKLPKVTML